MGAPDAVKVPMMPMLRYTHVAWGLLFTGLFTTVSAASLGSDDGAALSAALFVPCGAWATWRWWVMGAVVTPDTIVMRGLWRSRTFSRTPTLSVACLTRTLSWRRKVLLGDWASYEMGVSCPEGSVRLGHIGMTFHTFEPGAAFADRIHRALDAAST